MKKIISMLLILAICTNLCVINVSAEEKKIPSDKIIIALQAAECIKEDLDLNDVDFEALRISLPIKAYEYTNDGFVYCFDMYPLIYNEKIVAFAIEYCFEGEVVYQISTELVKEINSKNSKVMSLAVVYDAESSYMYDGENLCLLSNLDIQYEGRGVLGSCKKVEGLENLKLGYTKNTYDLGYGYRNMTRIPIYYECSVEYVPQIYTYTCWAASAACIVNYLQGTDLTAGRVAQDYYGEDFNRVLPRESAQYVLARYSVAYTFHNERPSGNTILTNIQQGYPLYGHFDVSNQENGHACVLYGYNISTPYLYVMDPLGRQYTAAYSNGKYSYVKSGSTFTLAAVTSKYWS